MKNKRKLKDVLSKLNKPSKNEDFFDSLADEVNPFKKIGAKLSNYLDKVRKEDNDRADEKITGIQKELGKHVETVMSQMESLRDFMSNFEEEVLAENVDLVFERLESIESSIEDMQSKSGLEVEGLSKGIQSFKAELEKRISSFENELGNLESKENSALISEEIKILKTIANKETFDKIHSRFDTFEKDLKKLSKGLYEFGSSFSVLKNGSLVGQTFGVDFSDGIGTTVSTSVNAQGFITVKINASSGNPEIPTGTIDGSNTVFTFKTKPIIIVVDQGRTMANGIGYTLDSTGLIATLDIAPQFSIFSL